MYIIYGEIYLQDPGHESDAQHQLDPLRAGLLSRAAGGDRLAPQGGRSDLRGTSAGAAEAGAAEAGAPPAPPVAPAAPAAPPPPPIPTPAAAAAARTWPTRIDMTAVGPEIY